MALGLDHLFSEDQRIDKSKQAKPGQCVTLMSLSLPGHSFGQIFFSFSFFPVWVWLSRELSKQVCPSVFPFVPVSGNPVGVAVGTSKELEMKIEWCRHVSSVATVSIALLFAYWKRWELQKQPSFHRSTHSFPNSFPERKTALLSSCLFMKGWCCLWGGPESGAEAKLSSNRG